MAVASRQKPPPRGRPAATDLLKGKRDLTRQKANRRRREIADLKADARGDRIAPQVLLADPRAQRVKLITLLPAIPRCTLHLAFEALLACQINGARTCGDLTTEERRVLSEALLQVDQGVAITVGAAAPPDPAEPDRKLDREIRRTRWAAAVELIPSEFAAARSGLEADPLLLRMVDRLVDAVRLYADRDDGGVRARCVAGQWLRFRNYRAKVVAGEYPPPTQRSPVALE
jgi:hypothetical protein